MHNVWKGFVIGAAAGAGVGLVMELLERAAERASLFADDASMAAHDLRVEAERRAPDLKDVARSVASDVASKAAGRAREAGAAASERASAVVGSR